MPLFTWHFHDFVYLKTLIRNKVLTQCSYGENRVLRNGQFIQLFSGMPWVKTGLSCFMQVNFGPSAPHHVPQGRTGGAERTEVHPSFCLVVLGRLVYSSKFLCHHLPRSNDNSHLMVRKDQTVARNAGVEVQLNKRLLTDRAVENWLWFAV